MSRGAPQVHYAIPTPSGWQRNLLIGLFVAYIVELVLHNLGVPLYAWLPWYSLDSGFEFWQPITRFVVQGAHRGAVTQVLLSLFMLFFFLPAMDTITDRPTLGRAVLAGAIGGTLLPFLVDLSGLLSGGAVGWSHLVMVLPVLLGVISPDREILLLVFPIRARWFVWGSLVLSLLYILVEQSLDTFQGLGVWLGVMGWWHLIGPGRRRRELKSRGRAIERQLGRFQVLEGGRGSEPQGKQSKQGGDDWIH